MRKSNLETGALRGARESRKGRNSCRVCLLAKRKAGGGGGRSFGPLKEPRLEDPVFLRNGPIEGLRVDVWLIIEDARLSEVLRAT